MMNAPAIPYPNLGHKDFAGSIVPYSTFASGRSVNVSEISPLVVAAGFSRVALAQTGITESLNRIVIGRSADLSPDLRRRIAELSNLKPNWDGEGAKLIKSHVLADVIEALKRFARRPDSVQWPFLAPTFDGYVQLEWRNSKRSLEIEAVSQGWSLVGTLVGNDGKRHYFTAGCERSDFRRLERFYEWFAGIELIWPSQ
jgi:hypothetical protein